MGPPQEAPEVRGKLGAKGLGAVGATTAASATASWSQSKSFQAESCPWQVRGEKGDRVKIKFV